MIPLLEEPEIRSRTHPISLEMYHALGDLGFVDERVELLKGVIVDKMSESPLHSALVRLIAKILQKQLPDQLEIYKEDPLTLGNSEPEPDLAIVDFSHDLHASGHPKSAHLVIEVAQSSLRTDREKAAIFAAGNVAEYWLVNVNAENVEVYSNPTADKYSDLQIFEKGSTVVSTHIPDLKLAVDDLFCA